MSSLAEVRKAIIIIILSGIRSCGLLRFHAVSVAIFLNLSSLLHVTDEAFIHASSGLIDVRYLFNTHDVSENGSITVLRFVISATVLITTRTQYRVNGFNIVTFYILR
jgi:hypothetical protein